MKLWGGRFTEGTDALVETYTASISFDQRLAEVDIKGSIAHAQMLGECGILSASDSNAIIGGLQGLLLDIQHGDVSFRIEDEDIHMNVERLLHERIGPVAGKLHTGRSRNDQVALDMHLFVRASSAEITAGLQALQGALIGLAEREMGVVVPGYTHLQRAQPILFSHHLLAYFWMFDRDRERFQDAKKRTDAMPLGAGALAGTTFPIDRQSVADQLGFTKLYENSLDAVSDRDYLIEFLANASLVMMHLSRLSEELILWSTEEFGWIELADAYCTGSSMMPQKKNPDVPELVRGKTGRVYGHLMGLLTVMKGLPLAYNKDMQEDKEGVFDTVDTLLPALTLFAGMIQTLTVRRDRIQKAFANDFSNATDAADYLVRKGVPFREAHEVVGKLVMAAIHSGTNLLGLPFGSYREGSEHFSEDIYRCLDPVRVANARQARGGTSIDAVAAQLAMARERLGVAGPGSSEGPGSSK